MRYIVMMVYIFLAGKYASNVINMPLWASKTLNAVIVISTVLFIGLLSLIKSQSKNHESNEEIDIAGTAKAWGLDIILQYIFYIIAAFAFLISVVGFYYELTQAGFTLVGLSCVQIEYVNLAISSILPVAIYWIARAKDSKFPGQNIYGKINSVVSFATFIFVSISAIFAVNKSYLPWKITVPIFLIVYFMYGVKNIILDGIKEKKGICKFQFPENVAGAIKQAISSLLFVIIAGIIACRPIGFFHIFWPPRNFLGIMDVLAKHSGSVFFIILFLFLSSVMSLLIAFINRELASLKPGVPYDKNENMKTFRNRIVSNLIFFLNLYFFICVWPEIKIFSMPIISGAEFNLNLFIDIFAKHHVVLAINSLIILVLFVRRAARKESINIFVEFFLLALLLLDINLFILGVIASKFSFWSNIVLIFLVLASLPGRKVMAK